MSLVTGFYLIKENTIMFGMQTHLLEEKDVCFGPIDFETHPDIESRWTQDAEFMRQMELKSVCPLTPAVVRAQYEALKREMEVEKTLFYFSIRSREDDRFIGKALIEYVDWTNGNGYLRLGIGEVDFRCKGYGSQALNLLLRYAFAELNLYRVTAVVPAYNVGAIRLFQKFGFMEEVRRRNVLQHNGKFWDVIAFGLLNAEWTDSI
jgi:RimJ/RimL family protein N-acetyltransferase